MAHYQIILAYDGTLFQGFQRQGSARTVQAEVETALRKLNWQGRTILFAGRTDSGVHGSGQVIAFDLDWTHSPEELGRALNASLPKDVAAQSVALAADDFHPRFDATGRSYQYHIYCQPDRDPLRQHYAWRVWPAVDLNLLQQAASLLEGIHDFTVFGTPPRAGGSTVREVFKASWQSQASGLLFEITANAFLYHMVRRLVFLQVLVGQGRLSLDELAAGVQTAQPQPPGLAKPQGLVLTSVQYGGRRQDMRNFRTAQPSE
jgi:tRNA pseudouridine38-40 synthase